MTSPCYVDTRERSSLDSWEDIAAELWVSWGDVEPHDADARERWLGSVVDWLRVMPERVAHVALWSLAQRVHYSLWTGYTEAEAYCWLRQAVWP